MVPKKIGILYLFTGIGHYRESYSIRSALKKYLPSVEVDLISPISILKKRSSFRSKIAHGIYQLVVNVTLFFNRSPKGFIATDNRLKDLVIEKSFKFIFSVVRYVEGLASKRFMEICEVGKYDLIISTHPIASGLLFGFPKHKYWNICPDEVSIATAEFYRIPNYTNLVNSDSVRNQILKLSSVRERLSETLVVGHPLDPLILSKKEKIFKRIQSEFSLGKVEIGLFIGGFGPKFQKKSIIDVIQKLADFVKESNIIIHVITGNHLDFERRLDDVVEQYKLSKYIKVYRTRSKRELVEVGHRLIEKHINVMFSRPSELVFYSMGVGMPHIMFDPLGPQEVDMYNLLNTTAGCPFYREIKSDLCEVISDKTELLKMSRKLYESGYNLNGSENVAKLVKSYYEDISK